MRSRTGFIFLLSILLPLGGLWHIGQGLYIHGKAQLAQYLLESAWSETVHGQKEVKPWPWADTWPVARLTVPRLDLHRIVLAGANGSSLAFGPGHLFQSASPGESGVSLIAGHRDTHFSFLQKLRQGDVIQVETESSAIHTFTIKTMFVSQAEQLSFMNNSSGATLVLITCYPFNAIAPGGDLRFVVIAEPHIDSILI